MIKSFLTILFFAIICALIFSCSKDEGNARINVRLHDNPAAYDSVKIDVREVHVHTNESGWIKLNSAAGIYDLLLLQNGIDTILVPQQEIPVGKLSQVRLVLGSHNTVVVSGTSYPLNMSSQDESGLKLNIHQDLVDNTSYSLVIDFVVSESVMQNGDGSYKLKPVLKASIQ